MNHSSFTLRRVLVAVSLLVPALAHAHPALDGGTHHFLSGAAHPLTGLDHACAMLAVGLWASQLGGRAVWALPLSFVGALLAGGALGMAKIALPLVEPVILSSLLVLGLILVANLRFPIATASAIVAGFALFHGCAHGLEMPATTSGVAYAAGFALMSALLHCAGLGLGQLVRRGPSLQTLRWSGAAVAVCGLVLFVAK